MTEEQSFRENLKQQLFSFVEEGAAGFPADEVVRVDLHCHDENSDVPDELLGRILHWPETWVSTEDVFEALQRNGATPLIITNHNNARSCWRLQDRGIDVIPAAEFTCTVPEFAVHIHVLTYGFTPAEENRLNVLRHNLNDFLAFAHERNLLTVLAHPLYFYSTRQTPSVQLIEHLTLMFDHFETLNGQRDTWQNLLVVAWLRRLNDAVMEEIAGRSKVPDSLRRTRPDKYMTGGSDDHMALFTGSTGTLVHVPYLSTRKAGKPLSALVLESLKAGRVTPYGTYAGEDKLTASFLDYFCQIVRNADDPGLIRLLLHQGDTTQKLQAFLIANGISELRRHKYTSRFIQAAHEAIHGKHLGFMKKYAFSKEYRPLAEELDRIADTQKHRPERLNEQLRTSVPALFNGLCRILGDRVTAKIDRHNSDAADEAPLPDPQAFIESLELPADIRTLVTGNTHRRSGMSNTSLQDLAEGLPFPALAAAVIAGSYYAGARVLFANRRMLDDFSAAIGQYQHPRRVLWLTDTFFDRNGVAGSLQLLHAEAVARNLPIDFAVCHPTEAARPHLHVLAPVFETELPWYREQPIRAFDIMELQRIFMEGGYDRVVCSTEGLMGAASMYLKSAFSVPAFFYLHTDWIDFARRTLKLDIHNTDRVRRLLRAFYRAYDGLFVLNSEQRAWLSSDAMGIAPERICQTAHWANPIFRPTRPARAEVFPGLAPTDRVVLFAGRVSTEKGVMELPEIMQIVKRRIPNARLAVAGTGPAEKQLRARMSDALFFSWVDMDRLAQMYPAADVLVLPSKFDTFGCVVLEALACGLPVVSYRTKGPADIIEDGRCGFTVETPEEMADAIVRLLEDKETLASMRAAAIARASDYTPDGIIRDVLSHLGL